MYASAVSNNVIMDFLLQIIDNEQSHILQKILRIKYLVAV